MTEPGTRLGRSIFDVPGQAVPCVLGDMRALARRERECVRLRREGLSWDEIGERLGVGPDTARRDWERATTDGTRPCGAGGGVRW